MSRSRFSLLLAVLTLILQACGTTRRFGTTIERDEENPCQVNMIVQVAIQGTDEDVANVRSQLEDCYNKECFISCDSDRNKGCQTKITVVVKKYSSLSEEEQRYYHYVQMVDNDGLPSRAEIGTANSGAVSGVWRRNEPWGTYCHEVLHFCGLKDQYCSRIYDPVTNTVTTELVCDPPPDPVAGNCCTPNADNKRCSSPCGGHETDLMATLSAGLSCQNIQDVLKGAGLDKCPRECCSSKRTFTRPPDEIHLTPGYFHFGDKNSKFGAVGGSLGYTTYIGPTLGIMVDGGYYTHTGKDGEIKETSGLLHVTGGIKWVPPLNPAKILSRFIFSTHILAGISFYTHKTSQSGSTLYDDHFNSLIFHIGGSLDYSVNRNWRIQVLEADYSPSFFSHETQQNFRLGAGIVFRLRK